MAAEIGSDYNLTKLAWILTAADERAKKNAKKELSIEDMMGYQKTK